MRNVIALFYFVGSENPCIYSVPNRKQSYEIFRKELHRIRKIAESGEKIYNAFLAPNRKLQVDPNKNVNIRFVIVAGRTPENDIAESDLRYQFGRDDRDVELFSWDSWIRRLGRV